MTVPQIREFYITPDPRRGAYHVTKIGAGRYHTERIQRPSGGSFVRGHYDHQIEVCVSPTGRSVQVHVDGKRVL